MTTSVKKENRWKRSVYAANDAASDRQREAEAACMVRGPRREAIPQKPCATRRQVRSWMRWNAHDYDDATCLAEAANAALDLPNGAMDDDTHWVWEEALSALEWADA